MKRSAFSRSWFLFFLLLYVVALYAQEEQAFYWMADQLHPCTGDSIQIKEVSIFTDAEQITLTVLGVSKEWTDYMTYEQEYQDFIHGVIELAGLQCAGAGGATSMPAQAVSATFKQAVFTRTAKPRLSATAAKVKTGTAVQQVPTATEEPEAEEATEPEGTAVELDVGGKEAGPRPMLPPNHVSTDLEWDLFSQKGAKGNNFSLRAGYARTHSNQKLTYGGTIIINTMLMMKKLFFNNALNLYGTWLLTETGTLERKVGGSFNSFIVDKTFAGSPFGMSGVVSFSDNWYVRDDNVFSYGVMVQQSFLADMATTLLTAGLQYGLPLGGRFALNTHLIYAVNVVTMNKNGAVDVESPQMFQPALNCSIYMSRLFSLDVGLKKTFLIKDYSDLIVTVGGSVLF
jgi:hypothetical protein